MYWLGQILAGWFVIDLISGLYHLLIDHYVSETNPILGSQKVDFEEHHCDRRSMEKHSFVARIILTSAASTPALFFAWLGWPAFWLTMFVGGCLMQQAHYYAHYPDPPQWAKLLQQVGIFISPEAHERHHANFWRSYGILNGWSHGTLDLILGHRY